MLTTKDILATHIEYFTTKIEIGEPFAFSRWGDGEWRAVFGATRGANCDGHAFTEKLTVGLCRVLEAKPNYMLGMQAFSLRQWPERLPQWLDTHGFGNRSWYDADVFFKAVRRNENHLAFRRFLSVVSSKKLIMIGPSHVQTAVADMLPVAYGCVVPGKNALKQLTAIIEDATRAIERCGTSQVVVSVSAGMPAKIIVHELWTRFPSLQILDVGSLWDPFANVMSRSWSKAMRRKNPTWQPPR